MRTYTGVVLALRPGPGGWRCALSRRCWIGVPASGPGAPVWILGARVRCTVERAAGAPAAARSLELVAWPDEAALRRRYGGPSAWGAAEAWLWRKGLGMWQVFASARGGHLIRFLRRLPAAEVWRCLADPFAWAARQTAGPVQAAPFGLWDAAARRLRPERLWPASWRDARRALAWRVALHAEVAARGLRPVPHADLLGPVRLLLRLERDAPVEPPASWTALGARVDADGRIWPAALDRRRAQVFAYLAANQRACWPTLAASADASGHPDADRVRRLVGAWTYSAIVGPAGSGKTAAVRRLAEQARAAGLRVALAALTGRAAAVLGDGAQTLHRLLRYGPWGWGVRRLDCDLVIVDEASMLTWDAAAALFEAARERVVVVGDPGQLPPVSGETVFEELLARLPVVRLDADRRACAGRRLQAIVREDADAMVRSAVALAVQWSREARSWQLLTPYRVGPSGCERLNRLVQEAANPRGAPVPGTGLRVGDRVILTRPHPPAGAPNGLLGVLVRAEADGLWLRAGGAAVGPIPADAVELAYALTVHRAQGSEWDCVALLCPLSGDRGFLDARLRYVALTRSRRETLCFLA